MKDFLEEKEETQQFLWIRVLYIHSSGTHEPLIGEATRKLP
jgi:hypothetical protein